MLLVAALACLGATAASGIVIAAMLGLAYGWPILALGLFPVVTAVLLVMRHAHADPLLRLTAIIWLPMVSLFVLPVILGPSVERRPEWWLPATITAGVGGLASLLALAAGSRHLRRAGNPP